MDENMIIDGNILRGYREPKIMMVVIPEGVAAISDNAFSDYPQLEQVVGFGLLDKNVIDVLRKINEFGLLNNVTVEIIKLILYLLIRLLYIMLKVGHFTQ